MFNKNYRILKFIICALCIMAFVLAAICGFEGEVVYASASSGPTGVLELGKNGIGDVKTKLSPESKNVYNIKFINSEEPYKLIEFTGDDATALSEGKDIELVLYAKKFTIPDAVDIDTTLLHEVIRNSKIANQDPKFISYMDLRLYKEIDGETPIKEEIKESLIPVDFTIDVPNPNFPLKSGKVRNYYLFVQDGEAISMEGPYTISNGHINFETQKFTTFALFFVDENLPVVAEERPPVDYSYNEKPTTTEELKEKIDSMINPTETAYEGVVYTPTINPNDYIEEEPTPDIIEPVPTPTGKSRSIPFKTIIISLVFLDLILLGGVYLFMSYRGRMKGN